MFVLMLCLGFLQQAQAGPWNWLMRAQPPAPVCRQALQAQSNTEDKLILKVTTDSQNSASGQADIFLVVDDQNRMTGMAVTNSKGRKFYTLPELQNTVTLVVKTKGPFSKDVIRLTLKKPQPDRGGPVVLTILREYGWFSDDYRDFHMDFVRDNGQWLVTTKDHQNQAVTFNGALFETRRDGDKEVGVEALVLKQDGRTLMRVNTGDMEEH